MKSKLVSTSWKYYKIITHYSTGKEITSSKYGIITFAPDSVLYYIDCDMTDTRDGILSAKGLWYFNEDVLLLLPFDSSLTSEQRGALSGFWGVTHSIESISSSDMVLMDMGSNDGYYDKYYFSKVTYTEGNSGGSGGDGGSSGGGDKPYVTNFNFTATKTSITVKFMCSERPTKATIKYGTSSPSKTVSSTISAKQVSATVSGLKSGTTYYFNCTVSNDKGSSTSETFPAITNY